MIENFVAKQSTTNLNFFFWYFPGKTGNLIRYHLYWNIQLRKCDMTGLDTYRIIIDVSQTFNELLFETIFQMIESVEIKINFS